MLLRHGSPAPRAGHDREVHQPGSLRVALGRKTGQFTGIPEHAIRLLEDDRLLLVFPEGARGTAKLFPERHSLVDFGTGFVRLALKTKTPIIPFGFLGGGEAMPTVFNAYALGKLLGVPYIPVTPYGLPLPLPAMMQVRFGEPLLFDGDGTEEDGVILEYVAEVKRSIAKLIADGRRPEPALLNAGPRWQSPMKVLVVGVSSAIAKLVVEQLLEEGHDGRRASTDAAGRRRRSRSTRSTSASAPRRTSSASFAQTPWSTWGPSRRW